MRRFGSPPSPRSLMIPHQLVKQPPPARKPVDRGASEPPKVSQKGHLMLKKKHC